ncbi:GntR family transcriptional regulator [Streptomyces bingchenggensis BCW-1]|uniref:GntR family transcriptional regulator n=1 Tax=Streptomyces bingchenggensis (strain BCW-1) TaxID=749414 RepID=D7BW85_STRBB|nr:GntR family transcriptional regulator [Streptomyces bingchenggensis BCW-1]
MYMPIESTSVDAGSGGPVVDDGDVLNPDVPMQQQIYRQLRAEILDGLWVGRTDFPGERELAERFKVSVVTARTPLERLGEEGLVERGRGRRPRATYVPPGAGDEGDLPVFYPEEEGSEYGYELLRVGIGVVPAEACRVFGLPPGSKLWQCARLRVYQGRPHVVTHNVQLPELGERHSLEDLRAKPMMSILSAEGVDVVTMRRRIYASTPPPIVSRHLGLYLDTPVSVCVLTLHDENGSPIEWIRAYVDPKLPVREEVRDVHQGYWTSPEQNPS